MSKTGRGVWDFVGDGGGDGGDELGIDFHEFGFVEFTDAVLFLVGERALFRCFVETSFFAELQSAFLEGECFGGEIAVEGIISDAQEGLRGIVQDGQSGLAVAVESATGLAFAMRKLTDDPQLRKRQTRIG